MVILANPISSIGICPSQKYQIIGVALFNGVGTASVLISSLSLTVALIGKNTNENCGRGSMWKMANVEGTHVEGG